jgi:hypothetical protein
VEGGWQEPVMDILRRKTLVVRLRLVGRRRALESRGVGIILAIKS